MSAGVVSISLLSLLVCFLISLVSGFVISAGVSFLIVAIMLNKSNRIGAGYAGFDDFTEEPLRIIRKEDSI